MKHLDDLIIQAQNDNNFKRITEEIKNNRMKYAEVLKQAQTLLALDPRTVFIGQAVEYEGTGLYDSLSHLPSEKRFEFPVAEYLQCGIANGIAIEGGIIPVSTFPRWNFLLMGTDQIVNHLDKFSSMSSGKCSPKVIIRVAVGSERPVDPQCQHKGNFSSAFRSMLKTIEVIELHEADDIIPAYHKALNREDGKSTILVEFADYSKEK
jgi:pyruvate/2-oxoglutarate/acetoin dehydrogenase E1 component